MVLIKPGSTKVTIFTELPEFEIIDFSPEKYKKKQGGEKFGFSLNNAMWFTTCSTLAYKKAEVINDVCQHIWGKLILLLFYPLLFINYECYRYGRFCFSIKS